MRKFLPIVLMALMVQILAPIAACWAAGIAASDPLSAAEICHDSAASASDTGNQTDQTGGSHVHDGLCCLACGIHAGASLDAPQMPVAAPHRLPERVVWHEVAPELLGCRTGSLAQARAPPFIS
ncbi:DUF2946 domain-containing protein [Bradyrhizobium sp. dw_78]|uniref:DUF2946 domain-containing protein n=1 Tax=Bradyrhizobium sp. dw_78 TaxID=2719793 RepID=UPI00201BA2EC|nr:DUF2946 domain-containing protein [Bradyrhizobium sp. dw_78]